MFGLRQFSWSGQNLLEEITDTTENLMKWNILLVKGKKKSIEISKVVASEIELF